MAIPSPRASGRGFTPAPLDWPGNMRDWMRKSAEGVNGLLNGKINATGSVTLTNSSTTTTLTDLRIGPDSVILFSPRTADAKTEGIPAVTSQGKQIATLTHSSDTTTRTYGYAVLG